MISTRSLLFLMLPYLALLAAFWVAPATEGAWMSTRQVSRFTPDSKPVGARNFQWALEQSALKTALKNTAVYSIVSTACILPLALFLAHLLLGISQRWRPWICFLLLLPAITPPIVLAILFLNVFHGNENGLLNALLIRPLGFEAFNFFEHPMLGLILQAIWRWTGFIAFLFLCGLESQPRVHQEAAAMDGAGRWARLRHLTLPLLKPLIIFSLVFLFIDTFVIGTGAFTLLGSSGGTANRGLLLVNYLNFVRTTIGAGKAAAISMVLLPALFLGFLGLFTLVQYRERRA